VLDPSRWRVSTPPGWVALASSATLRSASDCGVCTREMRVSAAFEWIAPPAGYAGCLPPTAWELFESSEPWDLWIVGLLAHVQKHPTSCGISVAGTLTAPRGPVVQYCSPEFAMH
jgi:hypothetical protein